jgi:ADP-heptose:LPS heptosyltransferase
LVFVGPEERGVARDIRRVFPNQSVLLEGLSIGELAAAQSRLAVFVSNDTGPAHIAAAVGVPTVVLILNRTTPHAYIPIASKQRLVYSPEFREAGVEEVYGATRELLAAERMSALVSR